MYDGERSNNISVNYTTWDYIKWATQTILSQLYVCRKFTETKSYLDKSKVEDLDNSQIVSFDLNSDDNHDIRHDTSFTLIDKYFLDLQSGKISPQRYQQIKREIFSRALPRNLSHDLEPEKNCKNMNSWIHPPALPNKTDPVVDKDRSQEVEEESCPISINNPPNPIITDCLSSSIEDERVQNFEKLRQTLAKPTKHAEVKPSSTIYYIQPDYRPKRCSSLKSSKAEGNLISEKKAVRFADVLGLDLVVSKMINDSEKPPILPNSALSDLNINSNENFASIGQKFFQLNFAQPCSSLDFYQRVLENKILLENASIDNTRYGSLMGIIRVKSVSFEKNIQVRVTYNNWTTFSDIKASYILNSHDGVTDKFSFMVIFPNSLVCGDKIEFAVTYQTPDGEKYWDNNNGQNYHIVCYAKQTIYSNETDNWMNTY